MMFRTPKVPFVLISPVLSALPCWSQAPPAPRATIPRVARAPTLEDFALGRPREAEAVITGFTQYMPQDGAPVSQATTAFLSYDQDNIYAGFICKDDPARIRAHIVRRDKLDTEDRVSLGLDTFHDRHRSYWFDCNPYACQMDGVTVDGIDDINFDAVWTTRAQLTPDGYVALITIPFKSLRFPSTDIQNWGFTVVRLITRNNEMACYPPISPSRVGWTTQFGDLEGVRDIHQAGNLQLIPYALATTTRYLDEGAPAFQHHVEGRGGLDAKFIFRDAFTLDATIHPDFSQVESDDPQVTVNQRYEVVYPEKRPFFLENANLFQTPTQLFFSRRIVDPHAGARLTGKFDGWALGALVTDDWIPDSPGHARVGVLRVFREMGQDNRLGMLVSERNVGGASNDLFSLDSRFRIGGNWILDNQWMTSRSQAPGGPRQGGGAGLAKLSWSDTCNGYTLLYEDRTDGFRTDLGYLDRVGIRRLTQMVSHAWKPNYGALLSLGPTLAVSGVWDRDGLRQNWEALPGFEVELTQQTHLRVERSESFERYLGLPFRKHQNGFSASSEPMPWLGLSATYAQGGAVNYDPAPVLLPSLGDFRSATAGITLRPNARLSMENTLMYNQLRARAPLGSANLYIDRIFRSKWNYQFTREFSLRAIFDYNLLDPDARYIAPTVTRDHRFNTDLLFTWFLHPGTAFYLGFSDLCRNLALDPTRPPSLRLTDGIGLATGTQAYVKVSYLLRP